MIPTTLVLEQVRDALAALMVIMQGVPCLLFTYRELSNLESEQLQQRAALVGLDATEVERQGLRVVVQYKPRLAH